MSLRAQTGAAVRSAEGFTSCGDAVVVALAEQAHVQLCAVVDALGHGPDAERSARLAADVLKTHCTLPLKALFDKVELAIHNGRGVVLSAVRVDASGVLFAGVGNVDVYGPKHVSRPACMRGYLGAGRTYRFREFKLDILAGQRWLLVSDGLSSRSMPSAMASAEKLPPEQAAQAVLNVAGRADDDASALVLDFEEWR